MSVHNETLIRQQATQDKNAFDLSMLPDADDEEDEATVRSGGVRKSPALARRSPGLRGGGSRHRGEPPATKVLDFLFLGNVHDAKNVEFLRRNNITTIINVSQEEYYSPDPEKVVVRWFYAEDTCNFQIQQFFPETEKILVAIRKKYFSTKDPALRERVLVHCQKGRSRSATIVMAHLIKSSGMNVAEALAWVTSLREQVEPNLGFIDSLREYQESLTPEERTLQKSRRSLLIRNMIPNTMILSPSHSPHTPLERDTRTSEDGTEFPLLTRDVVRTFFHNTIGMVTNVLLVQAKAKAQEGLSNTNSNDSAEPEEADGDVTLKVDSYPLPATLCAGSNELGDAKHVSSGSAGESPSVSPQNAGSDNQPVTDEDAAHTAFSDVPRTNSPPRAVASTIVRQRSTDTSKAMSRSDSGILQPTTARAQILVEFACYESVDIAGLMKKNDPKKFFPICQDPSTVLFQNPTTVLSKTSKQKRGKPSAAGRR